MVAASLVVCVVASTTYFGAPLLSAWHDRRTVEGLRTQLAESDRSTLDAVLAGETDKAIALWRAFLGEKSSQSVLRKPIPEPIFAALRVCAAGGSAGCMMTLGELLGEEAHPSTYDPRAAKNWLRKAAETARRGHTGGDVAGTMVLATMLHHGLGMPQDKAQAQALRTDAARRAPERYGTSTAREYIRGYFWGWQKNLALGVELAEAAAHSGKSDVVFEAAEEIAHAAIVASDDGLSALTDEWRRRATILYSQAAAGGDARAMYELGVLTRHEEPKEARLWFEKAAAKRNYAAMVYLATRPEILLAGNQEQALREAWIEYRKRPDVPLGIEMSRAHSDHFFIAKVCYWLDGYDEARRAAAKQDRFTRLDAWCAAKKPTSFLSRKVVTAEDFERSRQAGAEAAARRVYEAIVAAANSDVLPAFLPKPELPFTPLPKSAKLDPPNAQDRTPDPWKLDDGRTDRNKGRSTFTIDNTRGAGSALVRLYRDGQAVRTFAADAGSSATASGLAPGAYRLRYKLLESGRVFEARDEFVLREVRDDRGVTFSRVTVTLYQVSDGNLQTFEVPADRF